MTVSEVKQLSPENLEQIIVKLPPGRARQRYERLLHEKICVPLGGVEWEELPALYFLGELLAARDRTPGEIGEIHRANSPFLAPGCSRTAPARWSAR